MKQQILIIHGGDAFDTYEDYLKELKSWDITLDRIRANGWKTNISKNLGDDFDVLTPKMPNPNNAKYTEWKIWFEKIAQLLDDQIILIGHSLGGIFLAKYLSENKFSKEVKALILVAPPYNTPKIHPLGDFNLLQPLTLLRQQTENIAIFHSKDDRIVPYTNSKHYLKEIPDLELITFEDRGHFNQEEFPEIVEKIRLLSKS